MELHEIAKKYSISQRRAYEVLHEVAEKSGINRADLLERPHKQHPKRGTTTKRQELPSLSVQEVKLEMDEFIEQGEIVLKDIEKILKDIKQEDNNNGN